MDVTISGAGLKTFSRFLQSLGRVGDELFIEVRSPSSHSHSQSQSQSQRNSSLNLKKPKLILSTVNASRSAFGMFSISADFFESFSAGAEVGQGIGGALKNKNDGNEEMDQNSQAVAQKVLLKTMINIFKQKSNLDSIEKCRIYIQSGPDGGDRIVVQLLCRYGIKKTHKLHYETTDSIHALYSKTQCPNRWTVAPKIVHDWLSFFSQKLEEVTVKCGPDWIIIQSFSEANHDATKRSLQTELTLDPEDFDSFHVNGVTDVTFSMKDLKTVLFFADALAQPITAYFNGAGQPLTLSVTHMDIFSADFVLATFSESALTQQTTTADYHASGASSKRQKQQQQQQQQCGGVSSSASTSSTISAAAAVTYSAGLPAAPRTSSSHSPSVQFKPPSSGDGNSHESCSTDHSGDRASIKSHDTSRISDTMRSGIQRQQQPLRGDADIIFHDNYYEEGHVNNNDNNNHSSSSSPAVALAHNSTATDPTQWSLNAKSPHLSLLGVPTGGPQSTSSMGFTSKRMAPHLSPDGHHPAGDDVVHRLDIESLASSSTSGLMLADVHGASREFSSSPLFDPDDDDMVVQDSRPSSLVRQRRQWEEEEEEKEIPLKRRPRPAETQPLPVPIEHVGNEGEEEVVPPSPPLQNRRSVSSLLMATRRRGQEQH